MDTRYKKFWPMANRCCQFYIFLHVLCLIIEGLIEKSQIFYKLHYKYGIKEKSLQFAICYAK